MDKVIADTRDQGEKHCNTKISITIEEMRSLWSELPDKQRMEVIKSVIWTAPNSYGFWEKVCKQICNQKFGDKID